MKARALVVAVDRPVIAADNQYLVTVIYANAQGHKKKKQVFTSERPKLHSWVAIDTFRAVNFDHRQVRQA